MPGTFAITTLGCQMNKSDSERIQSLLIASGLKESSEVARADVIVYNTCSVRQKAEDRMYGIARFMTQLKSERPEVIIAVTGCMAGRDKDGAIRKRLSAVDLFFPTEEMIFLPQRISELNPSLIDPNTVSAFEYQHYLQIQPRYQSQASAYVAISNGCNKFCAYCVVPYSRGRQKDRPLADIIDEVEHLSQKGCKEITLLGQTVNLYNPPDTHLFSNENPYKGPKNFFAALLWEVNQVSGIQRIHFTAPHPQYVDDQMLDALTLPRQVPYLHLPVQSGSNSILKRMNRPYTREYYIDLIQRLYEKIPLIALGTDIIVGFSGETRDDFEQTLDLYRTCNYDIAYTAMYSVRSGTLASKMYKDDVERIEKKQRWRELQDLMETTVLRKNQRYIGQCVEVLVDSCDKGTCSGNSREMKRVLFRGGDGLVGELVRVRIQRALEWVLYGETQ